ncbi:MAG: hypothetical protein HHAS10_09780 [Candidatus Altimarinota bacterium]
MEKKGIIPKFKKKLTAFLTEEAGSIRREDILTIGAATLLVAGGLSDQANAYLTLGDCHTNHNNFVSTSDGYTHSSGWVHSNTTPAPLCMHENYTTPSAGGHGNAVAVNTSTAGSDNKIVNGHYNQIPSAGASHVNRGHANVNPVYYVAHNDGYVYHSSHANHSDGG